MVWINTDLVVARVADEQAVRDVAAVMEPRETVCSDAVRFGVGSELAVADDATSPIPTASLLINDVLRLEALVWWCYWSSQAHDFTMRSQCWVITADVRDVSGNEMTGP
jgi:hypothetical protein